MITYDMIPWKHTFGIYMMMKAIARFDGMIIATCPGVMMLSEWRGPNRVELKVAVEKNAFDMVKEIAEEKLTKGRCKC